MAVPGAATHGLRQHGKFWSQTSSQPNTTIQDTNEGRTMLNDIDPPKD
jgi:hypothetical protein